MYKNIDYAIASVMERGHELTVPNVLAAYMHCLVGNVGPDDVADPNAVARVAIASFERAMDKYPAPASLRAAQMQKTKAKIDTRLRLFADITQAEDTAVRHSPGGAEWAERPFCQEVAQLRDEYQKAVWRIPEGYNGCTCPSCGCLVRVPADQVRKLGSDGEEDGLKKKVVKRKNRAVQDVPIDPYAPSTSRVVV
ncbi:hypothetical protein C8Q73DRAFT_746925 [Cubamyces lactineus]|nr:hypothetical protein C8Q73DRAFT_746925 [Cubamyces lactineus]